MFKVGDWVIITKDNAAYASTLGFNVETPYKIVRVRPETVSLEHSPGKTAPFYFRRVVRVQDTFPHYAVCMKIKQMHERRLSQGYSL